MKRGLASSAGLVISFVLLSSLPAPASAQTATTTPRIDPEDPCSFEGLPAITPNGHRIAYVSCWTDLSDALDARLVIADAADGHAVLEMPLARRPTGGEGGTPSTVVRRRVARANRALAARRFVTLVQVAGLEVGSEQGTAGRLVVRLDANRRLLLVRDGASGRERGRVALPENPQNPYCCGGDPDDTTSCSLPPEVRASWTDAQGRVVVAEVVSGSGAPDGCEGGPDFVIVAVTP